MTNVFELRAQPRVYSLQSRLLLVTLLSCEGAAIPA